MTSEQKIQIKELRRSYKANNRYFAVLADCLFEYGEIKEAQKLIKKHQGEFPNYLTALLVEGKILYYKKAYDEAKELFLKIIKLNSKCVRAYKFLGDIELKLDNREGYLNYYTEIIRYDAFNVNAKNVISLLGKTYDFSAEDDLISKFYSDQNVEQNDAMPLNQKEQEEDNTLESVAPKISLHHSRVDLGNSNYKQAVADLDQYISKVKKDSSSAIIDDSEIAKVRSNSILDGKIAHNSAIVSKERLDDFFQAQLTKPDKVTKAPFEEKKVFFDSGDHAKAVEAVLEVEADSHLQNAEPEKKIQNVEIIKEDSYSDVEAMFESVTNKPENKAKITISALEKEYESKQVPTPNPEIPVLVVEPLIESMPEVEIIKEKEPDLSQDLPQIKDLKAIYRGNDSAVEIDDNFELTAVIGEQTLYHNSQEDHPPHEVEEQLDRTPIELSLLGESAEEDDKEAENQVLKTGSMIRHYDDIDLVEEERIYAQAAAGDENEAGGFSSICVDIDDNSFKKVVVDKVMGEVSEPKKRSLKIATSTLGEIYNSQGEFHKAKENYSELISKHPQNNQYRIKYLEAEFNIASMRINEELEYYRNLMEQYPDMLKYRERFESYQAEYNTLKQELDEKIVKLSIETTT